jgi:hypothetical protein
MAIPAPAILTYRPVIDAEGYPLARPRRAEAPGRIGTSEGLRPDAAPPAGREPRTAGVLAFPRRVAERVAGEDNAGTAPGARPAWRNATGLPLPGGAFLAHQIAQERLGDGLALDPHPAATRAYARSGRLAAPAATPTVDLSI